MPFQQTSQKHQANSENAVSENKKESEDNQMDTALLPTDILYRPTEIIYINGTSEKIYTENSDNFDLLYQAISSRFPQALRQASLDFDKASTEEMVIFKYNEVYNVQLKCLSEAYEDFSPTVSFTEIVFPLSDHNSIFVLLPGGSTWGELSVDSTILDTLRETN